MTKRKKLLLVLGGSVLGLVVLLIVATFIVIQTSWFANFVKGKIIAAIDDSTGGKTEIGSVEIDLSHLTVRIRDFVLHGKERAPERPLARVALLELQVKLFSGIGKVVDLRYLGIDKPQVNLIFLPDGSTNIPEPKTPSKPSSESGLQTVVDLAVNRFEVRDGLVKVLDQQAKLNASGENLRALLNYDTLHPSYSGEISIDPLIVASSQRPPLRAKLHLPLSLEPDALHVTNASLDAQQSHVGITASVENMKNPRISGNLTANISLPEIQRSFDVPFDANAPGVPQQFTGNIAVALQNNGKSISIETAHLALGKTVLDASGPLSSGAGFHANLALDELARLFKVTSVKVDGALEASGKATLDADNDYKVDGSLATRGLAVRSGTTDLTNVSLRSPFHADPYLVSLDGLKLSALGGDINAKVFVEKLQTLSAEAALHNFSIPVLAMVATGKHLGYDGFLNGSVKATGDLKAKGTTGYNAQANLTITPGHHGVPLSGLIGVVYKGTTSALDLGHSYLALPNSKLTLSGSLNHQIDLALVSHNLNDFLPAVNFGSTSPQTSLPVTLQPTGELTLTAQLTGNTAAPNIGAHLDLDRFSVQNRPLDRLAADVSASHSGAAIKNGSLSGNGLSAAFDGSIALADWMPVPHSALSANVTAHQAEFASLMALAGQSQLAATGLLNADIHVNGTYGNPVGGAVVQITNGSAEQQSFSKLFVKADLADQLVSLSSLELDTAGGKISASGTFRHPRESFITGHGQIHLGVDNIQLEQIEALARENAGISGVINLAANGNVEVTTANGKTELTPGNIIADLTARQLQVQHQNAGELTATVRTANNHARYNLESNFAGSNVHVTGDTALSKDYTTNADLTVADLSVKKALALAGQAVIPASGDLSAKAHVQGTLSAPIADLNFDLLHAKAYEEVINSLRGAIHYSDNRVQITSLALDAPAGKVELSGSFQHPASSFQTGSLSLNLNTSNIDLARIHHVEDAKPGLGGTFHATMNLLANLDQKDGKAALLIQNLNSDIGLTGIHLDNDDFGDFAFHAKTESSRLAFRLDSNFAKSSIHGQGSAQLTGDYPINANLSFNDIKYSNLAPLLQADNIGPVPYEGLVDGTLNVAGPALDPDSLVADLQLSRLDLHTNVNATPTGAPLRSVTLQNKGPIEIALSREVINVKSFQLASHDTYLNLSGSVNLKDPTEPLNLKLGANLDLGLLQDADRDFLSSGHVTIDAGLYGSFAAPRTLGEIDLKNANVNYSESPNGLSNANGVILLNGTNATIQSLTAESGGGKISVTGFVGLGSGVPSFNLAAIANHVRVRYSGVSITSNANIILTGNVRRSLLSGNVSVQRIAYASSSDAGSILSTASTPPSIPSSPSPLLTGMRLAVHIATAPDIQVVSTYANRLSVIANLTLRGTAESPGMLGRVTVTDGQLVFFGNTYTVTTGTINFYDPTTISPVLNVSLETVAQGVNVTLGVAGPMNDLKLSYRSDPPLTFEEIVQLLATNTTPSNPVIAAHQPTPPQQSLSQMGESAVLGQAVANPLANRVQRVFGLTQFKIDPSFAGSNGQPTARVTLQQKITSNLTFTYITDVSQTNSQIVRVQLDLTNNLSAVALRDYNGNVSLEMFYNFSRH